MWTYSIWKKHRRPFKNRAKKQSSKSKSKRIRLSMGSLVQQNRKKHIHKSKNILPPDNSGAIIHSQRMHESKQKAERVSPHPSPALLDLYIHPARRTTLNYCWGQLAEGHQDGYWHEQTSALPSARTGHLEKEENMLNVLSHNSEWTLATFCHTSLLHI